MVAQRSSPETGAGDLLRDPAVDLMLNSYPHHSNSAYYFLIGFYRQHIFQFITSCQGELSILSFKVYLLRKCLLYQKGCCVDINNAMYFQPTK